MNESKANLGYITATCLETATEKNKTQVSEYCLFCYMKHQPPDYTETTENVNTPIPWHEQSPAPRLHKDN